MKKSSYLVILVMLSMLACEKDNVMMELDNQQNDNLKSISAWIFTNTGSVEMSTPADKTKWDGGNWSYKTPPRVVNDPVTYSNSSGNKVIQTVSYFGCLDNSNSNSAIHCQLRKQNDKFGNDLLQKNFKRTFEFNFYIPSSNNPAANNYVVADPVDGQTRQVKDNGKIRCIHQFIQNYHSSLWTPNIMFLADPNNGKIYFRNVTTAYKGNKANLQPNDPQPEERDFELMGINVNTWHRIKMQARLDGGSQGRVKLWNWNGSQWQQLSFKQVQRNNHNQYVYENVNGINKIWERWELMGTTLFEKYFDIDVHAWKNVAAPKTYFSTETYAWWGTSVPSVEQRAAVTYHDNIKNYAEDTYPSAW